MPQSLYELLIMTEAMQNFDIMSKNTDDEKKDSLVELRDQTAILIGRLSNVISYDIEYVSDGYAGRFHKDMTTFLRDPNLIESTEVKSKLSKILKDAESLDCSHVDKTQKMDYEQVKQEPLYKRIMGQNAHHQILIMVQENPEFASIIGDKESLDLQETTDIQKLSRTAVKWEGGLQEELSNGTITQDQYNYFVRQINYLTSYYASILKGEQQILEAPKKMPELLTEIPDNVEFPTFSIGESSTPTPDTEQGSLHEATSPKVVEYEDSINAEELLGDWPETKNFNK